MKRYVALYASCSVRDAQVLKSDPNAADAALGGDWQDVKSSELFIGFFCGESDEQVRNEVAASEGVHKDSIRLIAV